MKREITFVPSTQMTGGKVLERLFTHFLISHELYERLSTRFQGLLVMRSLGSSVSGEEKLFYFIRNSCHFMLVPSKPSRIGRWMYELISCTAW